MSRYNLLLSAIALSAIHCATAQTTTAPKPNIIFILSDDLNWGDTEPFGQQLIQTPNIARIAQEGILFSQAYAGNSVCAPSRSTLMQGKHPGHARVRDNSYEGYREALQPGDSTVAQLLKQAGYATGLFGKWGLSNYDQTGLPNDKGFDEFFGYLNQQHAHNHYPHFLYHNKARVYYPENGDQYKIEHYGVPNPYNTDGQVQPLGIDDPADAKYAFDEYARRSLDFVRENKDHPFFLFLAYTLPHGNLIVPELGPYKDKDWPIQFKEWAAMVTRMDTEIGKLLALLEALGIDDNTLIIFASDNGNPGQYDKAYPVQAGVPTINQFFNNQSPTRGGKGNTYHGAFHTPALARWPKHIAPGQQSDLVWAFWDFVPTAAELAGVPPLSDTDGISIVPTLTGEGIQQQHEFLYWEYQQDQLVRYGNWYARKVNETQQFELYDLVADPAQSVNVAVRHPDIVSRIQTIMANEHQPSDVWPSPGESEHAFQRRLKKQKVPPRPKNVSIY